MAAMTDSYMGHVSNVLDMLTQDRTLDPVSFSFLSSPTPLLFDLVSNPPSPLVQKIDAALLRVVQKMVLMEHELVRHRSECPALGSTYYFCQEQSNASLRPDLVVPSILTPPVDPLSPPMSASTHWSQGAAAWEFMDQAAPSYPKPTSYLSQARPSLSSLHPLSDAVALSSERQDYKNTTPSRPNVAIVPSSSSSPSSPTASSISTDLSSTATALTIAYPINPSTTANLGSRLLSAEPASSMPSSPDSFRSALSTLPSEDSDVVPTIALPIPSNANLSIYGHSSDGASTASAGAIDAPLPVSYESPCPECIRNCALVATAVVKGELGLRITCRRDACNHTALTTSINEMVSKLSSFTDEVIQVAAQGVEGNLGVQAKLEDEHGSWKEFISHLNTMTVGHSEQVRDIASVCTAVAHGDLSQKITVSVKGETLVLKNTINTMVDQLRSFSSEVTRVAHEVGTEGKLGGQAHVKGVDGTWKELTDNVNTMAANLTAQVRDIASVSKAVAEGDLSKKISVEVKGEMMDLKHTINTMVDQLQEFATEVSRVSLEVGTEGKLGGQAVVKDVSGTWKELTDNVNLMASNLTGQVRDIAKVCKAVACGDLTKKVNVPVQGEILELKETMNTTVDQLRRFAAEVTRVAREVGTEGKLGGQAEVEGVDGTWKELTDNVNTMAENLTAQVRDIANVSKAVARGDLSKKISVEVKGEMMDLKHTINIMVDQLQQFATEVSRVSLEVGTEGKLGGQAVVKDVSGTWKELTDNVNTMASNLTTQVRSIAEVTTAVACGDLSKKIDVEAQGEISELKLTVNSMVEQLRTFAAEVTRVAREVGTEGKLGGQAHVKG
ncbi:hypothetical protein BGZ98_007726, partial [Dissophora globulifera]